MTRLRIFLLALVSVTPVITATQATFSSQRESVRVDVLVTDGGRIVRGLTRDDFEVFDSGVRQEVELVSFEQLPLNVLLALDLSASVRGERLDHLRSAGGLLLHGLHAEDQSALLTFGRSVVLEAPFAPGVEAVRAALARMQAPADESSGSTALLDAAFAAFTISEADLGRTLVIVFSDGVETSSWLTSAHVVEAARRSGAVVYGVSTQRANRMPVLTALAAATGGDAISLASTRDSGAAFVRILGEFRQRYLVSYSPQGVAAGGWHPLQVRVRGRAVQVRARAGYGN